MVVLAPRVADSTCNVIPSVDRTFSSSEGEVLRPFARPGDPVTITRDTTVFSANAAANAVLLTFRPLEADPVTVGPLAGAPCEPGRCIGGRCSCVEFAFPDTDAQVGAPDDGHPLTWPVEISVLTDGAVMARIDQLFQPGSQFHAELFELRRSAAAEPARRARRPSRFAARRA